MKLINTKTKEEVKPGDKVITFRGEEHVLKAAYPPGTSQGGNGEGKVQLEGELGMYYAGVIGCEFVAD